MRSQDCRYQHRLWGVSLPPAPRAPTGLRLRLRRSPPGIPFRATPSLTGLKRGKSTPKGGRGTTVPLAGPAAAPPTPWRGLRSSPPLRSGSPAQNTVDQEEGRVAGSRRCFLEDPTSTTTAPPESNHCFAHRGGQNGGLSAQILEIVWLWRALQAELWKRGGGFASHVGHSCFHTPGRACIRDPTLRVFTHPAYAQHCLS